MSAPDPETEAVDQRRKLWNAERLAQSWAMETGIRREDGLSLLAVLGDAALPVAVVLDRPTIDGEPTDAQSPQPESRSPVAVATDAGEGKDGGEGGVGYSVVRTDELERLQEIEADASGRFKVKEIIKPDRDADFYVGWSHICEMPAWCGTRAEAIAEGCPPSRLRRADERGTSMRDDFGCDWDDAGLIAEQRGFLPRARIGAYATAWLEQRMSDAFDLLEPFDGETEVRRD